MTMQTQQAETEVPVATRTTRGFLLNQGETRRIGTCPLNIFGDKVCIKLDAADTAGGHAIMECVSEPRAGPPLHRHSREDESFFVVEGQFRFVVDGTFIDAEQGSFVFAPRGSAHTYQNIGDKTGRLLVIVEDWRPSSPNSLRLQSTCRNRTSQWWCPSFTSTTWNCWDHRWLRWAISSRSSDRHVSEARQAASLVPAKS